MAEGMGGRESGVDLSATTVSFLLLSGVRVERDGRGGCMGGRVAGQRPTGCGQPGCTAKARSQR